MIQHPAILIFIGPPGAGKGTISQRCMHAFGWLQLSTGNLCRKAIADDTPFGREIAATMSAGKLVPDSLIEAMVEEWLTKQFDSGKTVILDGYPRARNQAMLLDNFLRKYQKTVVLHIVRFVVPKELVTLRLSSRLVCANHDCQKVYSAATNSVCVPVERSRCDACHKPLIRRDDDNASVIQERLATYHKHEQELLSFYRAQGKTVHELEAEGSLDEVFERFCVMVGSVA